MPRAHNGGMRTHIEIIEAVGGYRGLAERLAQPAERIRFWERRKAIPPEQWKACSDAGVATLDELASAAAQKAFGATSQAA